MSVEVMRSVIEAAEGRVPVDTLFANACKPVPVTTFV